MTMLTNIQPAVRPWLRSLALLLLARQRRLVNTWVARLIARRERQAALYALRHLDRIGLKDVGIYGCQPYDALEAIARQRVGRQLFQS